MILGKISSISSGLVLNRKTAKVESEIKKRYQLITLRSINDSGWIDRSFIESFGSMEILKPRYITNQNDIIMRLSSPYTCVLIDKDMEGFVVPSQFSIIRITDKSIEPGYIAFYLNTESTKQDYFRTSLGSTIPVIRVSQLKDTEVPIIPLKKQKAVAEYRRLMIKEQLFHNELLELLQQKNKQIELRILEGMKNDK